MSDPHSFISVATIASITGAIFGALSSIVKDTFSDSRKRLAEDYNQKIDDIIDKINYIRDQAVEYWTSDTFLKKQYANLLLARSDLYALISYASKDQYSLLDARIFQEKAKMYCDSISGDGFGAEARHSADMDLIVRSSKYYSSCVDYARSAKYRWSLQHLIPGNKIR